FLLVHGLLTKSVSYLITGLSMKSSVLCTNTANKSIQDMFSFSRVFLRETTEIYLTSEHGMGTHCPWLPQ
ncbi:hypothetical protein ACQP3C_27775, partial [Escherichia coli]